MADDIPSIWRDINDLLRKKAPKRQKELQPGLPEGELEELVKAFGRRLPKDYLVSIALHDGNASLNEFTYLPLRSVLEIWEAMNESEAAGEFGERTIDAPEAKVVKPVWWHKGLIPFAQDGAGNLLCIDLDPGPKGSNGQITRFERNMGPAPTEHRSFGGWLTAYRDAVRAGDFKIGRDQYLRDVGST
jgi:cell wall assembly regulator SMI1